MQCAMERKQYCPTLFLDVSHAFNLLWQEGLLVKISGYLLMQYKNMIASYLRSRQFQVCYDEVTSQSKLIRAGVSQSSVLGPCYTLYTTDITTTSDTMMSTFADDTALLTEHSDYNTAVGEL